MERQRLAGRSGPGAGRPGQGRRRRGRDATGAVLWPRRPRGEDAPGALRPGTPACWSPWVGRATPSRRRCVRWPCARPRARAAPEDAQRERDLAVGLETAAHVHAKAGLRPQACRLATRALTTWTRIDARGHLNRRDAANDLPAAARTRADYCGEPTPRPGAKKNLLARWPAIPAACAPLFSIRSWRVFHASEFDRNLCGGAGAQPAGDRQGGRHHLCPHLAREGPGRDHQRRRLRRRNPQWGGGAADRRDRRGQRRRAEEQRLGRLGAGRIPCLGQPGRRHAARRRLGDPRRRRVRLRRARGHALLQQHHRRRRGARRALHPGRPDRNRRRQQLRRRIWQPDPDGTRHPARRLRNAGDLGFQRRISGLHQGRHVRRGEHDDLGSPRRRQLRLRHDLRRGLYDGFPGDHGPICRRACRPSAFGRNCSWIAASPPSATSATPPRSSSGRWLPA